MNIDKISSALISGPNSLSQSRSATSITGGAAPTSATPGLDFGSMLNDLAQGTVDSLRKAEAASISGVKGQASVQQVVEAVMNAEQTLQGALAIRDKAVAAYLEISRMQI